MKNFKRFTAAIAATLMAASLSVPMAMNVSAATAGEISFNGATAGTHTYTAYQIFKGTAETNGFGTTAELKNTDWADGVNSTEFLSELKTFSDDFEDCETAAAVAAILKDYSSNSDKAKAFAEFAVEHKAMLKTAGVSAEDKINVSDDGYYVIEETELENGGTRTAYLLGVYDSDSGVDINVKSDAPTFEKKIMDTNDSGTTDGSTNDEWQDSADYDINDKVPFQLTATLPSDYATYKQYKLVFHDNLQDDVFTYDANSVKVYYRNTGDSEKVEIAPTNYTVKTGGEVDTHFESNKINDNTCNLEVTFDDLKSIDAINAGAEIIVEYTATLGANANLGEAGNWNSGYLEYSNNPYHTGEGAPTSKTVEDIVVAFTYQLTVDKVDASNKPLNGAGFTLYKYNGTAYEKVGDEITGVTSFNFKGIDAGQYKLEESTVPKGYNKAADIEFEVKATHVETADTPSLTSLTVIGAGETSLEDGAFTITQNSGELKTAVINNSGAELPSTGGMGTKLFFLGGGSMAAVAGIFLITKKRMGKNAE